MPAEWVELGRIGSAFGVRGWVRVESWTDPPERLFEYGLWCLRSGRRDPLERRLLEGRAHGKGLIARLDGIDDRNAAESLRGAVITVPRSQLPPPGEREYYRTDLIGLTVKNVEGAELGALRHFVDTPGGPVMVVQDTAGRERWIPAVPRHLRRVDLAGALIEVDWPEELG